MLDGLFSIGESILQFFSSIGTMFSQLWQIITDFVSEIGQFLEAISYSKEVTTIATNALLPVTLATLFSAAIIIVLVIRILGRS